MPTSIPPIAARGIERACGDRQPDRRRHHRFARPHWADLWERRRQSTLLRILAGIEAADAGTVERPRRTGILWQESPVDERATIRELLDGYTSELRAIERELQDAADALDDSPVSKSRYERALEEAERAEVWTLVARRDEVLQARQRRAILDA